MPGINLLVFRNSKSTASLPQLCANITQLLGTSLSSSCKAPLDTLIAAGQLESALADRNSPLTPFAGSVTDALARACVDSNPLDISSLRLSLETLAHDSENALQISDPEGFSYYSLHPLDFADAMTSYRGDAHVGVVGIRSIGTTLSAVAVAALRALGVRASRITVRPSGHPYDRRNDFTQIQKLWVEEQTRSNAKILIVDEGPGLSGSSFLSVAESLVRQGVLADQITILGTHVVGPENLCTPHSTERWQQYRSCTVGSRVAAEHALLHSISGGSWRQTFLYQEDDWPASWTEMESSKFISPDPRHFFKFEGLGPAGAEVRRRAIKLSDAGFTPLYEDSHEGVTKYELVAGRPLCVSDLSHEVLDRIVDYCSFRANAFQAANCGTKELERMLAFNYSQETGSELDFRNLNLACLQPVIPDNRMQPHKWIQRQDGRILKVDANRHGDDHFWPGPTDILWDLAGAVVEWDMTRAATDYLMHRFHKQTGRDASEQTTSFALAYSCFRMAYSKMAMHSVADEHEKARFWRAHKFYHHRMMAAAAQAQAC